ncbi:hypothetical protein Poly24_26480 [Rosistilla carotiformis]|uniref:Uncharacterized protein n=2 Tax=Rosistilla carotiformis TaxID=2528017 RepID=A0A518JTR6_9BACT|nr:hypothetical protein Poly24_26480 [Rosistilla carotiformis]
MLDGQPAEGLEIEFAPTNPGVTSVGLGFTQADGSYSLHYPGDDNAGAPPGDYVVRIRGAERDDAPMLKVVDNYNTKSELTATVERGANTGQSYVDFVFGLSIAWRLAESSCFDEKLCCSCTEVFIDDWASCNCFKMF